MQKSNRMSDVELLEELRSQIGANYISDLRYSPYHEAALRMIKRIPQSRYESVVWADAYDYLSTNKSDNGELTR